ncbi:UNVERIFIED_ORG: Ti-type conjugative transfer relaxase TraA [Methylobacterium sp. SuP10 SLI 274]|uniref:Ti-type conjugative transfer relaxase TraA n=1 Tax=Methylorubrum extorquens TaxID=408 RepID=UPI0020A1B1B9|nr:Ti-type conjugative transfer relaxase TraA [Methylorubrum extorquens]MCP1561920.1 Ti-type conjugative transfer relaxase TraA [Methylorubrum extorquens]MDF9866438.1 Ti-type conjugative transfer relaxase TraA [Methylorubrum pseudosasae]MDH6639947.1 Ti-type conjugative transfer relaxase TraA [Methylobacterium sp. SuP10 SLI 274]MDH6669315.1 Ti-type conjugative transfer relaxase TraA [Methylorubrum zatmanii]
MAIYHLSVKAVSRASGRSATAAAAYRSASLIADARTGEIHDYQRRGGVAASFIVVPEGAEWAQDRAVLWNAAEAAERRKDAKVAREYQLALPHELTPEERQALARDFAEALCARYGVAADVAIHAPNREGDERNWHVHILTTTRAVTPDGLGAKTRVLDVSTTARVEVEVLRALWEDRANEHLARAGHSVEIDRRSHVDRDLSIAPSEHVGVHATQMQRRGKTGVDRLAIDPETAARNAEQVARWPGQVLNLITSEKAVFTRQDVARALHRAGIDEPAAFQAALARVMGADGVVSLPSVGRNDGERFTTRALLTVETDMARHADGLLARRFHEVGPVRVEAALSRRPELAEEQRAAVRHVTGPEGIASVVGLAGAGKSTMLGAAREAWEAAGYRVHGAALAGKAAEGLQASSGIPSRTLASWQLAWRNERDRLTKRDVLVIDEAGMASSLQIMKVLREAERAGAKVVLVGDPEQLQPIGPGAGFRALSERTGFLELAVIRRQREGWQRAASVAFGTRNTRSGLEAYRAHGAVQFSADGAVARERLVADYLADRAAHPADTRVALAHTRAEVRALNDAVRDHLRAAGELRDEAGFTSESAGQLSFAAGDRIVFLRNDRVLGVKNGTLGTVSVADEGRLAVTLDDGRGVTIAQDRYATVDHGYATTIHKSQGATVDRSFVLASSGLDRHLTYVAMTRHREAVGLYAGADVFRDFEALAARLERGRVKASVLDYLGEAPERAGLQPGDRPVPLLEPQRVFAQTLGEIGREAAEDRLAGRLAKQGYGLEAVFGDPEAVAARLRVMFDRPDGRSGEIAHRLATSPETFGELRGRRRRLLGDDRERREARAVLPTVASRVRTLLGEWEEAHDQAVSKEKRRRELAKVEIPGLSEAAQEFLRDYRAGSREAGEVLIAGALRTEAGRGVMEEFRAVSAAAKGREEASQAGVGKYAFLGIPGMDRERSLALGETVTVIRGIDRDQGRIAYEQERAERRALEQQRELERAQRLGLDHNGPVLGL